MPLVKYRERRAIGRAYLCISIVTLETSDISTDDCFAALCFVLSHWSWFNPLSRGRRILYHNPPKKVNKNS